MSYFDKNIKPEEKAAGFDVQIPDDETFEIEKTNVYPGKTPDFFQFGFSEFEKNPELEIEELFQQEPISEPEFSINEFPSDSVDDSVNFSGFENDSELTNKEFIQEEPISEPDFSFKDFPTNSFDSPIEDVFPKDEPRIEDKPVESVWDMFNEPQHNFDEFLEKEPSESPKVEDAVGDQTNEEVLPTDLDNEFINMLKDDLNKSKSKQKQKELGEDEFQSSTQPFKPVDENNAGFKYDFGDINAEHPSTFNDEQIKNSTKDQNNVMISFKDVEKPKKQKKEKKPKEKVIKEKKPFPWMKFVAGLAILIGISALTLGGYYLYQTNGLFGLFPNKTDLQKDTTKKVIHKELAKSLHKEKSKDSSNLIATDNKKDTAKSDLGIIKPNFNRIEEQPKAKTDLLKEKEQIKSPSIVKPKEDKIEKKDIAQKTKPKISKNIKSREYIAKEKSKTKSKDIASDIPKKSKSTVENTKPAEISLNDNEKGLFIVQIYSTSSREDAEEWLQKLKSKNVNDAFISTQQIRDKTWYRVRFGAFETREEAKNSAIKLGFAQSWIDRVR